MYYIYRDTFLPGWGKGRKGSFVISDLPLHREEFKLIAIIESWDNIVFANTENIHICYWCKDGNDYLCHSQGILYPLIKEDKPRNTWDIEKNTKKGTFILNLEN